MNISGESKIFIGIVVVSVAILGGILFLGGGEAPDTSENILVRDNSQVKGSSDAKVTLVEFSDFQCPACRAASPIVKQVEEDYKKDLRFVYRHFPLSSHKNARLAAESAEAAGEQNKFWEYHDVLFERQSAWSESKKPRDLFEDYAKELKLDLDKFKQALDESKFKDKVASDVVDGNAAGVNATPTFFLNGERITGVPNLEDLRQRVDTILAESSSETSSE